MYHQLLILIAFGGILRFVSNKHPARGGAFIGRGCLIRERLLKKITKKGGLYLREAIKRSGGVYSKHYGNRKNAFPGFNSF